MESKHPVEVTYDLQVIRHFQLVWMKNVQSIVLACSLRMRPLEVYVEDTRHMYNSIIVRVSGQSRGTLEQRIGHDFLGTSMWQVKTDYKEEEILEIKRKNALYKFLQRLLNPTT